MINSPAIRFERLTTFEQFCMLEQDWNSFGDDQVSTIFLTHAWLSEWWKAYGEDYQLWTLIAHSDDRLVGIVPLMMSRSAAGVRALMFMGSGEVCPNHLDILAIAEFREAVIKALADYLCKASSEWDYIELNKIPGDSSSVDMLRAAFRNHGKSVQAEVSARCSYIDLQASFDEFLLAVDKKTQKNIQRSRRHLVSEIPDAHFRCVETPEELKVVMDALIRLHQVYWTKRGYPGSFASKKFTVFHRSFTLHALQENTLRMFYLQIGSDIASVIYCFKTAGCVEGYLSNFDHRWSRYSPGVLAMAHIIEQSILEGARRFDLLEGEEDYKDRWQMGVRENLKLSIYNNNLRGVWMKMYLQTTSGLMRWSVNSVPAKIRRPLWLAWRRWKASRNK